MALTCAHRIAFLVIALCVASSYPRPVSQTLLHMLVEAQANGTWSLEPRASVLALPLPTHV